MKPCDVVWSWSHQFPYHLLLLLKSMNMACPPYGPHTSVHGQTNAFGAKKVTAVSVDACFHTPGDARSLATEMKINKRKKLNLKVEYHHLSSMNHELFHSSWHIQQYSFAKFIC